MTRNDRHFIELEPASEPALLRRRLEEGVSRVLTEECASHADLRLVRLQVRCPDAPPLAWLQAQPLPQKIYWSGRNEPGAVAAVGTADRCRSDQPADLSAIGRKLPLLNAASSPPPRYYGGLRFDPRLRSAPEWAPFPACWFVLPRFELSRSGDGVTTLRCNLVLPRDRQRKAGLLEAIRQLTFPSHPLDSSLPLPVARNDTPHLQDWTRQVEHLLSLLDAELKKVVLARRAAFTFTGQLSPFHLLNKLQADTPGCFHFLFQPREGTAFLGASPERLLRRDGRQLQSEALAGTRPRADTASADEQLHAELFESEKDRREHEYVRQSLQSTLRPFCTTLRMDAQISQMKLARGRHLYSELHGRLHPGASTLAVLSALHPTPAVGGLPKDSALHVLRRLEDFDRGWYAGPVGWIGPDEAEFAVAIRSGLVQAEQLALFSGAGIVDGSAPRREWTEIEQKISDFVQVLDLDLEHAAR